MKFNFLADADSEIPATNSPFGEDEEEMLMRAIAGGAVVKGNMWQKSSFHVYCFQLKIYVLLIFQ